MMTDDGLRQVTVVHPVAELLSTNRPIHHIGGDINTPIPSLTRVNIHDIA